VLEVGDNDRDPLPTRSVHPGYPETEDAAIIAIARKTGSPLPPDLADAFALPQDAVESSQGGKEAAPAVDQPEGSTATKSGKLSGHTEQTSKQRVPIEQTLAESTKNVDRKEKVIEMEAPPDVKETEIPGIKTPVNRHKSSEKDPAEVSVSALRDKSSAVALQQGSSTKSDSIAPQRGKKGKAVSPWTVYFPDADVQERL